MRIKAKTSVYMSFSTSLQKRHQTRRAMGNLFRHAHKGLFHYGHCGACCPPILHQFQHYYRKRADSYIHTKTIVTVYIYNQSKLLQTGARLLGSLGHFFVSVIIMIILRQHTHKRRRDIWQSEPASWVGNYQRVSRDVYLVDRPLCNIIGKSE